MTLSFLTEIGPLSQQDLLELPHVELARGRALLDGERSRGPYRVAHTHAGAHHPCCGHSLVAGREAAPRDQQVLGFA